MLGLLDSEGRIREANGYIRETGHYPANTLASDPFPLACTAAKFKLKTELPLGGDKQTRTLDVIQKDRECTGYYPWRIGLTPQEHRAIMRDDFYREEAERRRKADQEWRDEQSRKQDEFHERMAEKQRAWQAEQERLNRAATIVAGETSAGASVKAGQVAADATWKAALISAVVSGAITIAGAILGR